MKHEMKKVEWYSKEVLATLNRVFRLSPATWRKILRASFWFRFAAVILLLPLLARAQVSDRSVSGVLTSTCAAAEKTIPAHTEPVYKWRCTDSLFAGEDPAVEER